MATKKQPASSKASAAKKTTASASKKSTKRSISPKILYTEKYPERHQATGKYKFFYILFACTTLFFAALTVELFVFASEVENKYEEVDACIRAHTKCDVKLKDGVINAEGIEE